MSSLKFRKVKCDSETCAHYLVIDTCANIQERCLEDGEYQLAVRYKDDDDLPISPEELGVSEHTDIASTDHFYKVNMKEYLTLALALKKEGYRFNKKTGEIINLNKKNTEHWT